MKFKHINLLSDGEMQSAKLAEELHWIKFADIKTGHLKITSASIGGVTIGDIVTDGYDAQTTTNRVTVSLPIFGRNSFRSHGKDIEAGCGDALLIQPGTRSSRKRADSARRSRTFSVIVPPPEVLVRSRLKLPAVMNVGGSAEARSLRDFLFYFFTELRQPDSPLRGSGASASLEALLTDFVHALCQAPTSSPAPDARADARVRAACDYMYAHAGEALTVQQIACAVDVGSRSLQGAFRDVLGVTPREKLTEIRMDHVRARLTSPNSGTTVTSAALESGFSHLGRFAASYTLRYGEKPSETLRRATR